MCRVTIHTARPGVIIGKKGADIEGLRQKIAKITKSDLHLNIVEVRSQSWTQPLLVNPSHSSWNAGSLSVAP